MEKRRPTHDLAAVKRAIGTSRTLSIVRTALLDATRLGFDRAEIAAVIVSVEPGMFYKSMSTYADHRAWQDVYHVPWGRLTLYVKVQADAVTEFRVMSFKEV